MMGSAIALRETCPPVPGTPPDRKELTDEIRELSKMLSVDIAFKAATAGAPPSAEWQFAQLRWKSA